MNRIDGSALASIAGILVMVCLLCSLAVGYGLNIYKLFQCDFKAPYKAEVIRVVGLPFVPVGIIAGYCDFGK